MKKVLIIGASGLVGGQCYEYLLQKDYEVVGTYLNFKRSNLLYFDAIDFNNPLNDKILSTDFDVIIHTAALTHVDYCEGNEDESYKNNVIATSNIISLAKRMNAKLCFTSSDYIFDGLNGPYVEEDAPNPLNVYGQHKLECEKLIISQIDNYLIARITNVYGEEQRNKNFIARLLNNNLSNSHLDLPQDQYATPINALDVARALFLLIENEKKGVYHLSSTDYYNRYQLASKVIDLCNLKYTTSPKKTSELNQKAKRPLRGGLLNLKFMSEFPAFKNSNIDDYLKQNQHNAKF